ncbi:hypothetical protein L1987_64676 [Smallanthus sonchifolius]|uniref:Uncharacterized protein n=1 Tax=Smallanthus sonchifolius TaxID=185202 RepID=A0ACB9BSE2_9ASTR|nr:hypothetical protein L1987_64676 [Smallanthus sonchifolius]
MTATATIVLLHRTSPSTVVRAASSPTTAATQNCALFCATVMLTAMGMGGGITSAILVTKICTHLSSVTISILAPQNRMLILQNRHTTLVFICILSSETICSSRVHAPLNLSFYL